MRKRAFEWSGTALPQAFLRRNEMSNPDCFFIASYSIAGDERRNSKTFPDHSARQVTTICIYEHFCARTAE